MDKKSDHIIKNFDLLASTDLRRQALSVAEAGLLAINTRRAVEKFFLYDQRAQRLKTGGESFRLDKFKKIICVGFGKAALEAVTAIQEILKDKITCGYVLDLKEGNLGNIVCRVGTHPLPTKVNIQATRELMDMLDSCQEDDLVICVVSGGGSALLCYPHDMSCETEVTIITALTVKGATIQELNTVRKHISEVKGGRLAKILYPATCLSLIFSDVPGDDISAVASGPTVKDATTNADAAAILAKYDVLKMCNLPLCRFLETPKEDKYFAKVHNFLMVSGKQALLAMRERAEDLGFGTKVFSENFSGEAKILGREIINQSRPGQALLGAGESTVKIVGKGEGGRNQEMALAALPFVAENQVLVCVASDGHDNTDAAGAIADRQTLARAKALGLEAESYLSNNDSFNFFQATGDYLDTGLTGANVSDFFVCLRKS